MDMEKVIKGFHYCTHTDVVECPNCPYWKDDDCVETLNADVLALLKEQEEEIENLKQTAQSMMEGICLLKEQKAVEPKTGHWFKIHGGTAAQCTICKCWGQIYMKFCPWCGAKMET